jgi:hypothetical protein
MLDSKSTSPKIDRSSNPPIKCQLNTIVPFVTCLVGSYQLYVLSIYMFYADLLASRADTQPFREPNHI